MSWHEFDPIFTGRVRPIPWPEVGFDPTLPLLDLGAGNGSGTVALAGAFPTAEVLAVEPDAGMRTLLVARVAGDPGLAERVTIWPGRLDELDWPDTFGGVVATGVLYFLSPTQRQAAWRWFAEHLATGTGVVVQEGDAPDPDGPEPERLVATRVVGRHRHERWFGQEPLPDGSVRLVNTVRVWSAERLLRQDTTSWTTWPLPRACCVAEAEAEGCFRAEALPGGAHWVARRLG